MKKLTLAQIILKIENGETPTKVFNPIKLQPIRRLKDNE